MKKTNWIDVATLIEAGTSIEAGKYFISEEGVVRTASKKSKKLIKDSRGYDMVVLENVDGTSVAYYILDLLAQGFEGHEDMDLFNLKALEAAKNSSTKSVRKSKVIIKHVESGEEFTSYSSAAKAFGFNYDKFYNAFYLSEHDTIEFDNMLFEKKVVA